MSGRRVLLEVLNLKKHFSIRKGLFRRTHACVKAVDGIDLTVSEKETLGLVGESGCGKTTAGRTILRLIEPTSGKIRFRSKHLAENGSERQMVDLGTASSKQIKLLRREMQIIFQDPYSSLDPRRTVAQTVGEPLRLHGIGKKVERAEQVRDLLSAVGLSPEHMNRYPHEFSGGQRQRIGIARALALKPQLIVADEPVSALDVSIQAQIINLLKDLQHRFGLTYLFISHDLSIVKYISDRVAVMYLGKIVETSSTKELFMNPKHPYSEALMSAVPIPNPKLKMKRIGMLGDVPSPINPPSGCPFHPRCRYVQSICRSDPPAYNRFENEHYVSCHLAKKLRLRPASL